MVAEVSAKAPASKLFNEIAGIIAPTSRAAQKGCSISGSMMKKMKLGSKNA